MTQTNHLS